MTVLSTTARRVGRDPRGSQSRSWRHVLLWDNSGLAGLAVCHCGAGTRPEAAQATSSSGRSGRGRTRGVTSSACLTPAKLGLPRKVCRSLSLGRIWAARSVLCSARTRLPHRYPGRHDAPLKRPGYSQLESTSSTTGANRTPEFPRITYCGLQAFFFFFFFFLPSLAAGVLLWSSSRCTWSWPPPAPSPRPRRRSPRPHLNAEPSLRHGTAQALNLLNLLVENP